MDKMTSYRLKIMTQPREVERGTIEPVKRLRAPEEYLGKRFSVLGVPFGGAFEGRDADGETFTKNTDLWLKAEQLIPVTYYHGFGPDEPGMLQEIPAIVGLAKLERMDKRGFWFDVTLDAEEPLAQRLMVAPIEKLRASSGAIGHLVRKQERVGIIDVWPLGELALFDTNDWRLPANDYAVVVGAVSKSAEAKAGEAEAEAEGEAQIQNSETPPNREGAVKMDKDNTELITEQPIEVAEVPVDIGALVEEKVKAAMAALQTKLGGKLILPAVVKTIGEPDREVAFLKYLRTGEKTRGLVSASKAALQEDTTTEGGFLVPNDFYAQIIAKRDEMSIARRAGARVVATSRDYVDFAAENVSETAFVLTAEEGAVDQNEPTFAQPQARIYKYTKLVKVSEELLEDEATNLVQFLGDAFGRSWAGTENGIVTTGTGSGQPQGVLVGGTAGLTFDSATTIGAAEIPELYWKLASEYHDGAVWVMRGTTLGLVQGLSGNNFQFVPTPNYNAMTPQLWGKPVFLTDGVPAIATAVKTVVYGNWYYYALCERRGMGVRRLNELYAGTGQVGFLATVRVGGVTLLAEAFQYATQA